MLDTSPPEATATSNELPVKLRGRKSPQSTKELDDDHVPLKFMKLVKKEKVKIFLYCSV